MIVGSNSSISYLMLIQVIWIQKFLKDLINISKTLPSKEEKFTALLTK